MDAAFGVHCLTLCSIMDKDPINDHIGTFFLLSEQESRLRKSPKFGDFGHGVLNLEQNK